jgi:hypothetical protein
MLHPVRVEFWRDDEAKVTGWDVFLAGRRPVRGSVMALGRGISSHDLDQYVVEAATRYRNGFWGLVAQGATFRSMHKTVTKPGRAIIVRHRRELTYSERLAATHVAAWRCQQETTVTIALDMASAQFRRLGASDRLIFEWPSPHGEINGRLSRPQRTTSSR